MPVTGLVPPLSLVLRTHSSPHTPFSVAQMRVHLCNGLEQSSAPSISSSHSRPARQSPRPALSLSAAHQTQSPSLRPLRLPPLESLQARRVSSRPRAAIHSLA